MVHLRFRPYRHRFCASAALASLFQLQLTYIMALGFYSEVELASTDDQSGWALVVLDALCFLIFVVFIVRAAYDSTME